MRKVVHKLFWVWGCEREEKWLNEMASKGFVLVSVGACRYEFEECEPGEYVIRTDYLDRNCKHIDSRKYIDFVQQAGIEVVSARGQIVYFRKRKEASFALFSDNTSRIKYYTRILKPTGWIGALELVIGIQNLLQYFFLSDTYELLRVFNLILGLLCTAFGVFCIIGFIRISRKRKALKEKQRLFE